jgi:hypothetical protein
MIDCTTYLRAFYITVVQRIRGVRTRRPVREKVDVLNGNRVSESSCTLEKSLRKNQNVEKAASRPNTKVEKRGAKENIRRPLADKRDSQQDYFKESQDTWHEAIPL